MRYITRVLFVTSFILGSVSFSLAAEKPQEISVIAKQFDFFPKQIEVELGRPVKLYLSSIDVPHGIAIKDFGVNQEIEKGRITTVEFTPDKQGEFEFRCSVYCGSGHREMKGKLIVRGYKNISPDELKGAMEDKAFFLLDVHIPEQEHIEQTDAFIPFNEIEKNIDKLPKDKNTKIVVYCHSGSMSVTASQTLLKLGYKNIYNLQGGIRAWKKRGY